MRKHFFAFFQNADISTSPHDIFPSLVSVLGMRLISLLVLAKASSELLIVEAIGMLWAVFSTGLSSFVIIEVSKGVGTGIEGKQIGVGIGGGTRTVS